MKRKGILIVVSGFSGSGKGTLMKRLLSQYPDTYALSISATTRAPRKGEEHGREYFFISKDEFEKMIVKGELIEYARYVENYYGTPRVYVEQKLDEGKDVILEIEIQGALKVKQAFPDTLLLFVTPPNAAELEKRLVGRGTETMDVIRSRLDRACEEAEGMDSYDYLIVNDELEACVSQMHEIIRGEHHRSFRNEVFIKEIKEDLEKLKRR
ncbi:MAG TPA: guanylate kinase [Candidatus Mediterraneibacter pullicola]|uniref:Guanylate kinase n=1 Tax=Candidatus Mediterraneibacter pullicola TaxID=2838682 RepID=A0A9D2KJW6_9FIRM|nr:guanylate kinase [Candidatus Mediterraneibacter pullicola]